MVKIKEIPTNDRPIERLLNKGAYSLSNEELLAIILRTGTKEESAKDLAANILKIGNIKNLSIEQLLNIKGIGKSKSAIIMALVELSKRMNQEVETIINRKGNSPDLLFNYYKNILDGKMQEYFYAIYLDTRKKIIKDKLLFIGTINYSMVHPRDIFKEAYICSASSIILIHNHPTGNIIPSDNDIETTTNLVNIGNLLGIKILDHIIIGKHNYYSFFENKII